MDNTDSFPRSGEPTENGLPGCVNLKYKEDVEFPCIVYEPEGIHDANPLAFGMQKFKEHKEKISESNISTEGLSPAFFSYYEGDYGEDGMFSPDDITISAWTNSEGSMSVYSVYRGFVIYGTIEKQGDTTDIYYYSVRSEYEGVEREKMFVEMFHRRGENFSESLSKWCKYLKEKKYPKAEEIYDRFSNPRVYTDSRSFRTFNGNALMKNPFLVLSKKAFFHFFNQPSVKERYESLLKERVG